MFYLYVCVYGTYIHRSQKRVPSLEPSQLKMLRTKLGSFTRTASALITELSLQPAQHFKQRQINCYRPPRTKSPQSCFGKEQNSKISSASVRFTHYMQNQPTPSMGGIVFQASFCFHCSPGSSLMLSFSATKIQTLFCILYFFSD